MKHYIFADESNIDKARYMLIGGIWVDEITYNQVKEECKKFKLENGWQEKTKLNWKSISKKTLPQYLKFIDIFFKYNLQFNCIILDRKTIQLKHNENRDEELGFYKFYYMLLRHNSLKDTSYYIYLDRRNNREANRLDDLKAFLKRDTHPMGYQGVYTDKGLNVKALEFVNSDSYNLIQFSDLLLGAIGYHYNHRHLKPDASEHKSAFAMYIANKIGKTELNFCTDRCGFKNMNLWLFTPTRQIIVK